jgi:hypothetical protein
MHQETRGVDSVALFLKQVCSRIGQVEGAILLVELRCTPPTTGWAACLLSVYPNVHGKQVIDPAGAEKVLLGFGAES